MSSFRIEHGYGEHLVWIGLDGEDPAHAATGFIIGTGPTPVEAAHDAIADLESVIARLRGITNDPA